MKEVGKNNRVRIASKRMPSMKFQQEITDAHGKTFSVRKVKESTPSEHECQGRKDDMQISDGNIRKR